MKRNSDSFADLYEPVWDYRSPEEQAEAEALQESNEAAVQATSTKETSGDQTTSEASVLRMKTDDGSPVILVQQVTRDSGINSPKAIAKRAFHSVTGFVGFIVAAVLVSIVASLIYNTVFNGLSLDRALSALFPFI